MVRTECDPVVVQLKALVKVQVVSVSNSYTFFNLPFDPVLLSSKYVGFFPLDIVVRLGDMDG